MPDIFLSYSREDQPVARRYAEALEREGFTVWWDQALKAGEAFDRVTEKALDEAKAVVVLWSRRSVESNWVRAEASQAHATQRLVPVMIEQCKRPIMFELTHTADLSQWKGDLDNPAWRAYVRDLRRFFRDLGTTEGTTTRAPSSGAVDAPRPAGPRIKSTLIAAAIVCALAIGAVIWSQRGVGDGRPTTAAVAQPVPVATAELVTLAVLPFVNLSGDEQQEYFSDGLTEEILNQLAQIKGLRVTGRTSSFSFKGKNEDLREIARKLDVRNLLEGSVRRDRDQLRITAQLIDGRDGAHLWSKTYDSTKSDMFALQDEVSRDVANALSVTLDAGEVRRADGGTTNVEAWERYQQARQIVSQVRTPEQQRQVIELCREAVRLDPQFALAWEALASSLASIVGTAEPLLPIQQAQSLMRESSEARARAFQLAPDAWWVRRYAISELMDQRKWAEAESLARPMAEGQLLTSVNWERALPYLTLLNSVGRVREAVQLSEQLLKLEPLQADLGAAMQAYPTAEGDCDAAERAYQRRASLTDQLEIDDYLRLLCMIGKSRDPAAIREQYGRLEKSAVMLPRELFVELSRGHGQPTLVARALASTLASPRPTNGRVAIAQIANAYGDLDTAFAALDTLPNPVYLVWRMAPWSGLRSDPRFKKLIRDNGVLDYWRSTGNWADLCKPVGGDDFECQ